jgi:hypothetical protein
MSPRSFVSNHVLVRCHAGLIRCPIILIVLLLLTGCSEVSKARRAVGEAGADKLRQEILTVCHEGFISGGAQKISETNWPDTARAFHPLGLWAEPDGAYLLIDSDADGERGVYLPRILSEKDPLCTPALKHEKLAAGVYWYDRKR